MAEQSPSSSGRGSKKYQVPSTKYQVPSTKYQVENPGLARVFATGSDEAPEIGAVRPGGAGLRSETPTVVASANQRDIMLEDTSANGAAARMDNGVKIYGEGTATVRALDGVSAEFATGQFTAIMGPSGSGKSTLLHTLAGLDKLTEGTVHIGETELGSLKDRQLTILRREKVGFIFQAYNLIPTLNAEENITLPLSIAGNEPDEAWFNDVVTAVGLKDRLDHRPAELSGGEQQRVAAARALVTRPDIVFADEPSGNLDSRAEAELLAFMRRAVDEFSQTIVMVTHDPVAASYADRIVFLDDGDIVDELVDPTVDSILEHMKHLGE